MKSLQAGLVATAVAVATAVPSLAVATNGTFMIGYGPKSRAMGGVGVAYGQDGIAAAANPAAMADVEMNVMRADFAAELFIPRRAAYHDSNDLPADEISGSNLFLIPTMGGIMKFNRDLTIGMAAIGAGFSSRYDQSCSKSPANSSGYFFNFNCETLAEPLAGQTVGVSLMQMQMLPSVAYRINKNHTVGASVAVAIQTFRAYGLGAFGQLGFTNNTQGLTNEGNDWSYGGGFRLGWMSKFLDEKISVGLNYASRVYMTEFKKYDGLFAEQGDLDIPEHYAIGIAIHPTDKWTIAFDVQRINFSDVAAYGNPGPLVDDPAGNPGQLFPTPAVENGVSIHNLGADEGMGFGWTDVTAYKLGVNYNYNSKWSFRAGFNYAEMPIEKDQVLFALLGPATVERHVTVGASYRPGPTSEISFNVMHAFKEEITGRTRFPGLRPPTEDNAAAAMYQWSFGASYGIRF